MEMQNFLLMELKPKDYQILSSVEKKPIKMSLKLIIKLIEETVFAVFVEESGPI
jgi:DNA polymerase III sliding clamp (beta) subunit (PCNA family)